MQLRPKAQIIAKKFALAKTASQWRTALRLYRETQMSDRERAEVSAIGAIAQTRLGLDYRTGLPRVRPRGAVSVRGKAVAVEVLT